MRLLLLYFLLTALPLHAQTIPPVGADDTFDVGTWNIEWLGHSSNGPSNDALQIDQVRKVIAETGIDLWGVQEIADTDDFDALLVALGPDYDGRLATNSVEQRIGFIFDTRVVRVRQVRHVLESFLFEFAGRPPLQLEADIVLPDTTATVTFIVVHMKAFSDQSSYERRVEASKRLKNHIEFTTLDSKPVIVLGDFNDELLESTHSSQTSPYQNFIDDPEDYFFASLTLEQSGGGSFCNNSSCTSTGSMLDHILLSNELFEAYIPQSAGFIPDLTSAITAFGSTTSDHLPVIAHFDFTRISGTGIEEETPADFIVNAPYPNPFSSTLNVPLELSRPAEVKIELFDALGRRIDILHPGLLSRGSYDFAINTLQSSRGTYFLRVSVDAMSKTYPVNSTWSSAQTRTR